MDRRAVVVLLGMCEGFFGVVGEMGHVLFVLVVRVVSFVGHWVIVLTVEAAMVEGAVIEVLTVIVGIMVTVLDLMMCVVVV